MINPTTGAITFQGLCEGLAAVAAFSDAPDLTNLFHAMPL